MASKTGKTGSITQDPNFLKYLTGTNTQNQQRMQQTYNNLGLDTSSEAMGMSPQESKDIAWLQQGAEGVGTQGFLQNVGTQIGNINAQNQAQGAAGLNAGLTAGTQTG